MEDYREKIEVIKEIMKSQGITSFNELAKQLDIRPNTLTSSCRYMTKNNSYDTQFATKLFDALGITKKDFFEALEKGATNSSVDTSIKILEEKGKVFSKIAKSYQKEISDLISKLTKGDTYTLITTENPWEFGNISIRELILDRIKEGVIFRYIYPKVTKSNEDAFEKFEYNIEWAGLEYMHKRYLSKMLKSMELDSDFNEIDEYKLNPDAFVEKHLKYYLVEDVLITHPLFKLMLLETQVYGGVRQFAFSEAIVGEYFREMNNEKNSFWYPLPTNASIVLFETVENIIKPN